MKAKKVNDIDDALSVLNQVADENSDDIRRLINRDYKRLKRALSDLGPEINNRVHEFKNVAMNEMRAKRDELKAKGDQVVDYSKRVARDVDHKVKERPWTFLGGAALGSILVGYFMGRSKHNRNCNL